MWTPLSASRCILLLTLGVVMLLSESGAKENAEDCCYKDQFWPKVIHFKQIAECWIQTSYECGQEAYWIVLKRGHNRCIGPDEQWLQDLIKQGKIKCEYPYVIPFKFEVLDEEEEEEE